MNNKSFHKMIIECPHCERGVYFTTSFNPQDLDTRTNKSSLTYKDKHQCIDCDKDIDPTIEIRIIARFKLPKENGADEK